MALTMLYIDERQVILPPATNIDRLRTRLARAMRRGGAFVRIKPAAGNVVEFLVGPLSRVRLEQHEADQQAETDFDSETRNFDFEL